MLRANHAVRLGLRAASRNPELAFGKALLDLLGSLLTALPLLLALVLIAAALGDDAPLAAVLHGVALLVVLRWPVTTGLFAAAVISWTLSMLFWAGALPLLAADAEMDARPPQGSFIRLCASGFSRTAAAGAIGLVLSGGFGLCTSLALLFSLTAFGAHPSPVALVATALVAVFALIAGTALDLLARLMLVRAAALGDAAALSFTRAAALLGERLGACFVVAVAFLVLELIVGAAAATLIGPSGGSLDPAALVFSMGARIGLAIASAVVFAWLAMGRQGALAAIAADAEGLLPKAPEPRPPPRVPQAWELRPPPGHTAPAQEKIIEGLFADADPAPEQVPEQVIEAELAPESAADTVPNKPGSDSNGGGTAS